jgi:Kef-type K+ transport system membrane component KefB
VVSFGLLTPFFFLHAGMNVSLPLVIANAGLLVLLLGAKLASKSAAVYPLARRYAPTHAWPVSLLMSTGLTFGTIASQAGLSLGVISRAQFSVLVCVVALSAVVPTVIAQRLIARNPVQSGELDSTIASPAAPGPDDDDEVALHPAKHPTKARSAGHTATASADDRS